MPAPKKASALSGWLGLAQAALKRSGRLNRPRSRQSECAATQPGGLTNKSGTDAARPLRSAQNSSERSEAPVFSYSHQPWRHPPAADSATATWKKAVGSYFGSISERMAAARCHIPACIKRSTYNDPTL